jgi:hypothetical protein
MKVIGERSKAKYIANDQGSWYPINRIPLSVQGIHKFKWANSQRSGSDLTSYNAFREQVSTIFFNSCVGT